MASALSVYVRGNKVITRAEWRVPDEDGTLTDPTTIVFTARRRGDDPTVYTYASPGGPPELTKAATGIYELALVHDGADDVGNWAVHAQGTGDAYAAGEIEYEIKKSGALA